MRELHHKDLVISQNCYVLYLYVQRFLAWS